ncbi:MAG: hypothetical protein FJ100_09380 [Deltaproteobacteria bacterium]|nr:hypothetical protein [Deltaproteobacteria bacterium]
MLRRHRKAVWCWPLALASAVSAPVGAQDATRIEVSDDGKALRVPGEAGRPPSAKLPLPTVRRTAADKPVTLPKSGRADGPAARDPAPVEREFAAVEFSAGYSWLPANVLRAIQTAANPGKPLRDRHPELQGTAIEAGYRYPLSPRSWMVVRGAVIVPNVADQNWYATSGSPAPLYTEIGLVGIELMADYVRRVPLTSWLGAYGRAGIGLLILGGGATQTETLPNCTQTKPATCATWRHVGKSDVALPPVLPGVRTSIGLDLTVSDQLSLQIEGGLRATPYFGAGAVLRL